MTKTAKTVTEAENAVHGMTVAELRAALADLPDRAYPRFRLTAAWHNDGGRALLVTTDPPAKSS